MFKFLRFSAGAVVLGALVACGGGGGSATPASLDTAPTAASASNQLATSVAVSGYSALSIASKTSNSMQTAGVKAVLENLLALLVRPAYAATCANDAYKLIGVNEDGTSTPLPVTAGGIDQCGVGFRSMFDAGNYILLTGDGIYKDDLTCNLVFLNKSNGELFCVGESAPAKYDILGKSAWKNYARLQLSTDKNYLFLEAAAVIFDSNNQITGKKTKLMRFDLSDPAKGPQGSVLVEGFQNSWLSSGFGGDVSQFEGFDINNYAGLDNGDAMVMYNRYVYSVGGMAMAASSGLSKQNNFYYRFDADGTFNRIEVDATQVSQLVTAEMQQNGNLNASFGTGAIGQIPCYFKSADRDKFYFAIPFAAMVNNGGAQTSVNKSLIVSAVRPDASATSLSVSRYTTSLLCANTWNTTTPYYVINGEYYNLDTSWYWDPNTNTGGNQTSLIKKDFGFATETPQNDVVYKISTSNSWWGGKSMYVSANYLYMKSPYTGGWSMGSTPGDTLERFDPATFNNTLAVGSQLGSALTILTSSDNISIQSISSDAADDNLKVVGRKTDDADLLKVYGTVDALGTLIWAPQTSVTYSPVTILKL
jgi:hypothetical protein